MWHLGTQIVPHGFGKCQKFVRHLYTNRVSTYIVLSGRTITVTVVASPDSTIPTHIGTTGTQSGTQHVGGGRSHGDSVFRIIRVVAILFVYFAVQYSFQRLKLALSVSQN